MKSPRQAFLGAWVARFFLCTCALGVYSSPLLRFESLYLIIISYIFGTHPATRVPMITVH